MLRSGAGARRECPGRDRLDHSGRVVTPGEDRSDHQGKAAGQQAQNQRDAVGMMAQGVDPCTSSREDRGRGECNRVEGHGGLQRCEDDHGGTAPGAGATDAVTLGGLHGRQTEWACGDTNSRHSSKAARAATDSPIPTCPQVVAAESVKPSTQGATDTQRPMAKVMASSQS